MTWTFLPGSLRFQNSKHESLTSRMAGMNDERTKSKGGKQVPTGGQSQGLGLATCSPTPHPPVLEQNTSQVRIPVT